MLVERKWNEILLAKLGKRGLLNVTSRHTLCHGDAFAFFAPIRCTVTDKFANLGMPLSRRFPCDFLDFFDGLNF